MKPRQAMVNLDAEVGAYFETKNTCKWSTMLGDPIIDCQLPLVAGFPKDVDIALKGVVVLRCRDEVIARSLVNPEVSHKSNLIYWSGASFDFNNVSVRSDKSVKDPSMLPPGKCVASQFSAELLLYQSTVTAREGSQKWSLYRDGFHRGTKRVVDPKNYPQEVLKAVAKEVAKTCFASPSGPACKRSLNNALSEPRRSNPDSAQLINSLEKFVGEFSATLDSVAGIECAKNPKSSACKNLEQRQNECGLGPSLAPCRLNNRGSSGGVRG